MKPLYPEIEPFNTFFISTDSMHQVYIEQCGNPNGIPVIFLHGGPCSGTKPDHRRFFDPNLYHIVLMDQRGCGRSLPYGLLEHNNTDAILQDIENLRQHLAIDQWLLFGGSWGATLALLYAQHFPKSVQAIILRGVFLARPLDLDWFTGPCVGRIYPEKWQQLMSCATGSDRFIADAYQGMMGGDIKIQQQLAKAWNEWGGQLALLQDYLEPEEPVEYTERMLIQVRMEIYFAYHRYFLKDNQILQHCDSIQTIPTLIIHGRNDLVCPVEAALTLKQHLPQAELTILPKSGHIASGDEMVDALVNATDRFANLCQKS